MVVKEAPGAGRVVCGLIGEWVPPVPSMRLARPKHALLKNVEINPRRPSDNNQTPRRAAQCCQPKRGKEMDDTLARAREKGCKVRKKEENRMQFAHKEENSKKKTNKNKQQKEIGEPGRTNDQLVQVSGFAKKE